VELPAAEALEADAGGRVSALRPDGHLPPPADLHARRVRLSTAPILRQGPSTRHERRLPTCARGGAGRRLRGSVVADGRAGDRRV